MGSANKVTKNLSVLVLLLIVGIQGSLGANDQVGESRFTSIESGPGRDVFWGLTDANKTRTCILLSGFFEIAVPYDTNYFSTAIAIIPVPRNASVNGYCDREENPNLQSMTLTWSPDSQKPEVEHSLTLTFQRKSYSSDEDEFQHSSSSPLPEPYYQLASIQGTIHTNPVQFPDAFYEGHIYNLTASNQGRMSAPESLSYFCMSPQVIEFDDGANSIGMTFVHVEAFHKHIALGEGNDFGPKLFCVKDGFEVIFKVLSYLMILALIGLAVFYIMDRRSKRSYIYL